MLIFHSKSANCRLCNVRIFAIIRVLIVCVILIEKGVSTMSKIDHSKSRKDTSWFGPAHMLVIGLTVIVLSLALWLFSSGVMAKQIAPLDHTIEIPFEVAYYAATVDSVEPVPDTTKNDSGKTDTSDAVVDKTEASEHSEPIRLKTKADVEATAPFYYIVEHGDMLGSLSLYFDVPMGQLVEMNHIENADLIYVGQRLWFPRP